jgi:ketosteroid isomerase-like protein
MELKGLRERMSESEKWKKVLSDMRLIAKPALITLAVIAGVVSIIIIAIVITREEDTSDIVAREDMVAPERDVSDVTTREKDEGVSAVLKRWKQIVEEGDVQAYEEMCSKEFKEGFRDSYEDIKNLIAGQEIVVDIEDEGIETIPLDDNHYVVKHIPMFLSKDGIQTHEKLDIKRKGLIKRRWEIDHEEHYFSKAAAQELEQIAEGKPAEPLAEPDKTPLDTDARVRQTLEVWRTAWNNKDLDGYMDCYADYADITRVTVAGGKEERTKLTKSKLRDHMARLSKKYSKIQVEITDLRIEGDTAEAKANFLQEYTSWGHSSKGPVYRDLGVKDLVFVKHDVEWKIANENWTLYKDVPVYPEREY